MTTTEINSIRKVRLIIEQEPGIDILSSCYKILETLLHQYRRVMNKAKEMEALQLLTKIKIIIIQQISKA